jgi:hypothetical protein
MKDKHSELVYERKTAHITKDIKIHKNNGTYQGQKTHDMCRHHLKELKRFSNDCRTGAA